LQQDSKLGLGQAFYLKKLPKKTRIVLNMSNDGEQPLNVLQEPMETSGKNAIMFNSFYEDEF